MVAVVVVWKQGLHMLGDNHAENMRNSREIIACDQGLGSQVPLQSRLRACLLVVQVR